MDPKDVTPDGRLPDADKGARPPPLAQQQSPPQKLESDVCTLKLEGLLHAAGLQ